MAVTKPRHPVTPLPIPDNLRTLLYVSAEKKGRKLTKHILMLLQTAMDKEHGK